MNVAVIGASKKPERYSNKAVKALVEKGHSVYPVHPALDEVRGIRVCKSLPEVPAVVNTVTLYVSAKHQGHLFEQIQRCGVRRVIFNPGTENKELQECLQEAGVEVVEGCTLVMLLTDTF